MEKEQDDQAVNLNHPTIKGGKDSVIKIDEKRQAEKKLYEIFNNHCILLQKIALFRKN